MEAEGVEAEKFYRAMNADPSIWFTNKPVVSPRAAPRASPRGSPRQKETEKVEDKWAPAGSPKRQRLLDVKRV